MNGEINILGKDFLTEQEAAHYACVSVSKFRALKADYGILHFPWGGKNCYRKDDIKRVMDRECQRSQSAAKATCSTGRITPAGIGKASERSPRCST